MGKGSNTYDAFPMYGASPFMATLYMAALLAAAEMAEELGIGASPIGAGNVAIKLGRPWKAVG